MLVPGSHPAWPWRTGADTPRCVQPEMGPGQCGEGLRFQLAEFPPGRLGTAP